MTLSSTEFHQTVKRSKPYIYPHCKKCHRQYVNKHYADNREVYIRRALDRNDRIRAQLREYLSDCLATHPCVDCGECDMVVLQFDHVRGKKLYGVGEMIRRISSLASVKAEIEKCDVVCANCHIRRTARQFGWWTDALVAQRAGRRQ